MKNTLLSALLFSITLFLLCFTGGQVCAQKVNRDSLRRIAFVRDSIMHDSLADIARIITVAKTDGRRLHLSTAQRQKFNADNKNAGSDLFKPALSTVSDTLMLSDSVYAKAFRAAAYKKAFGYRKRTAGHYILVGGIAAASAVAAFFVIGVSLWLAGGAHVGV
ncbi:MAG TPA: hypothetical protein VFE53_06235 [Mucilaginibacter sp.]|jgi:hypothetical protein|nr:hypothetical protein [Mucilaginibacter sp.]